MSVMSILILSIASHSVFVILACHLTFISFDVDFQSIQLSLFGVFTAGRALHQCNTVPPMTVAVMPDIAVFDSKCQAPFHLKDFVIAFSNVDFPVPPGPITIINFCFGCLPAR